MMKIGHLNVRSLPAHFAAVRDLILRNSYDVFAVSETWVYSDSNLDLFKIENYTHQFVGRGGGVNGRGGGIGLYVRDSCKVNLLFSEVLPFIEQLWVEVCRGGASLAVAVIYRPDVSVTNFLNQFEELLSDMVPRYGGVVCLGDFNINGLGGSGIYADRFLPIIEAFDLRQIITAPTRVTVSTATLIDYVIVANDAAVVDVGVIPVHDVADHSLVFVCLGLSGAAGTLPQTRQCRDFRNFNEFRFLNDLQSLPWHHILLRNDVNEKVDYFNFLLLHLFDMHAPFKTITLRKNYRPWITDNIKLLMRLRDNAYTRFKKSRSPDHFQYYRELRNYTNAAVKREKRAYLEHFLRDRSVRELWDGFRDMGIIGCGRRSVDPAIGDVETINNYFLGAQSRSLGDGDTIEFYNSSVLPTVTEELSLSLATETEISTILYSIKTKAKGLDGLSCRMLTLCCPFIIPYIAHIINWCLEHSVFPDCWKMAMVMPVPKVTNPSQLTDLRPISILPVLSKVLEKVVATRLNCHLNRFNILPVHQSGFRRGYSCATALLDVTDNIVRELDIGKASILVLLDFSKAFDTLHHDTLLAVLHYVGLSESAVRFFRDYLSNRRQFVILNGLRSAGSSVLSGVPQGSVLGPLLYLIYTSDLCSSLQHCSTHMYADDTQLYHSFYPDDMEAAQERVNRDLGGLITRASKLCLNINPRKSSVMVFGHRAAVTRMKMTVNILISGVPLSIVDEARSLGVVVDSSLRFRGHVASLLRRAYSTLRLLYGNRCLLSQTMRSQLCEALVLSVFNHGDAVINGYLDVATSTRIQRLQNSCLRFIFGIRRRDRISHALGWIGWLNMSRRRLLRSACLYHRIILSKTPPYLYCRIRYRTDVHNINVRHRHAVCIPRHRTQMFKRCFSYCLAVTYNSIPVDIRRRGEHGFRTRFKACLVRQQSGNF